MQKRRRHTKSAKVKELAEKMKELEESNTKKKRKNTTSKSERQKKTSSTTAAPKKEKKTTTNKARRASSSAALPTTTRTTKKQKELQIDAHKAHLVCLLIHHIHVNKQLDDEMLKVFFFTQVFRKTVLLTHMNLCTCVHYFITEP